VLSAILVPGATGAVQTTLLDLGWEALTDRRASIEQVSWQLPQGLMEVGPEPFVRAHVAAALHRLIARDPDARPVLIAKSLGTHAATLAADLELPAIWLTPLLTVPPIVDAIARNPARQLLIGGTADRWWVPEAARATGQQVLTVRDANHSLRAPGTLRDFAETLGVIGTAIEDFLDAC
jgi:hypothetical protein